jgi:ribosomal-protein-alanine N-acetyltransferase
LVAILGIPGRWRPHAAPRGVTLRTASPDDLPALADLDAQCFDDFWGYRAEELSGLLTRERCVLAETAEKGLIGYTLATVSRGAAMLSRLCTAPQARRMGVGAVLLADVGEWCRQAGASTIALCTQEENAASRALYASAGLVEIRDRYALALGEA